MVAVLQGISPPRSKILSDLSHSHMTDLIEMLPSHWLE